MMKFRSDFDCAAPVGANSAPALFLNIAAADKMARRFIQHSDLPWCGHSISRKMYRGSIAGYIVGVFLKPGGYRVLTDADVEHLSRAGVSPAPAT